MALIEPQRPRSSIHRTAAGLEIHIPARRNWFIVIFLAFWLCGWAVGEFTVLGTLLSSNGSGPEPFLIIWLLGWTVGGAFAFLVLSWSLAGTERIVLGTSRLAIKREVFGVGTNHEYELSQIRDLRCAPQAYNPLDFRSGLHFWGLGGGSIAFDHGAATIRFGGGVEEGEARSLVEQIRNERSIG